MTGSPGSHFSLVRPPALAVRRSNVQKVWRYLRPQPIHIASGRQELSRRQRPRASLMRIPSPADVTVASSTCNRLGAQPASREACTHRHGPGGGRRTAMKRRAYYASLSPGPGHGEVARRGVSQSAPGSGGFSGAPNSTHPSGFTGPSLFPGPGHGKSKGSPAPTVRFTI